MPVGNALEMQSTVGLDEYNIARYLQRRLHMVDGAWWETVAIPQVQNYTSYAKNDICSLNLVYLSTYRIYMRICVFL